MNENAKELIYKALMGRIINRVCKKDNKYVGPIFGECFVSYDRMKQIVFGSESEVPGFDSNNSNTVSILSGINAIVESIYDEITNTGTLEVRDKVVPVDEINLISVAGEAADEVINPVVEMMENVKGNLQLTEAAIDTILENEKNRLEDEKKAKEDSLSIIDDEEGEGDTGSKDEPEEPETDDKPEDKEPNPDNDNKDTDPDGNEDPEDNKEDNKSDEEKVEDAAEEDDSEPEVDRNDDKGNPFIEKENEASGESAWYQLAYKNKLTFISKETTDITVIDKPVDLLFEAVKDQAIKSGIVDEIKNASNTNEEFKERMKHINRDMIEAIICCTNFCNYLDVSCIKAPHQVFQPVIEE